MLYQELREFCDKFEQVDKIGFQQLRSYHEILGILLAGSCVPHEVDPSEWMDLFWKGEDTHSAFLTEGLAIEFAAIITSFQKKAKELYKEGKGLPQLVFDTDQQMTEFALACLSMFTNTGEAFQEVIEKELEEHTQFYLTLSILLLSLTANIEAEFASEMPTREEIKAILPDLISKVGQRSLELL
jgi:uncharacterized protein YecA (UPF0149 family)